jgi:hypothetical protein
MVGLVVAAALVAITLLGFLTSAAFNVIIGRQGPFVDEALLDWTIWGIRGAIAPALYMAVMLVAGVLIRWLALLVSALARRIRGPRAAPLPARSIDPNVLVRIAAVLGAAALAAIFWRFADLLSAVMSYIEIDGAAAGAPFAPGNAAERFLYRRALELTMLVVAVMLYRAVRLKRQTGAALDTSATAACGTVLVVAVLMTMIPYRIMLQNQFPRARFDGRRCYVLGQAGQSLLLHCPESISPNNQTVSAGDARLRLEGITESLFIPADQAAPPPRE